MMIWFGVLLVTSLSGICTADSVKQPKPAVMVEAKEFIHLDCEYSTTDSTPYLFWYVQYPGQGLNYILRSLGRSEEVKAAPKFSAKHDIKKKVIPLMISDTTESDSGVYFCALNTGYGKQIFGAGTQLTVIAQTDRTSPSVYQLTSYNPKESLLNTVCLLTDFPSPNTTLKVDEQSIDLNDKAALDKSSSDVWRYSAVIWDQNKNLNCAVKYNDRETVLPDTIIDDTLQTCITRTIRENFKTDMNLNSLSFSVLGLRLLVVKGLLFNLVSTAKLWSI